MQGEIEPILGEIEMNLRNGRWGGLKQTSENSETQNLGGGGIRLAHIW